MWLAFACLYSPAKRLSGLASSLRCRLSALTQRVEYDTKHFFFRSRFPGPDLKLTSTLMNEHFDPCNYRNPFFARHADQWCLYWIVDEIENQACIDFLRFENMSGFYSLHSDRRCIHNHVELCLGQLVTTKRLGFLDLEIRN